MTYFSKKGNVLLAIITLVLVLIGLWAIIFVAPMIPQQEWAQRIFYYHVPLAWNAFLGYMGVLVFSIIYLVI